MRSSLTHAANVPEHRPNADIAGGPRVIPHNEPITNERSQLKASSFTLLA